MSLETELDLVALRQIADSLMETNRVLHSLAETVQDVREDVAAIKAQDLSSKYESLLARVNNLENHKSRGEGSQDFVNWMLQQFPWLVTLLAIAGSYWASNHHPAK